MRLPILCAFLVTVCSAARLPPNKAGISVTKHAPVQQKNGTLPVVLWHGMGDSAHGSIEPIITLLQDEGVWVLSIATGDGSYADMLSSYYGSVNDQVAKACALMKGMAELSEGYNAIGFSQGGQFMRAVVQRCSQDGIRARTLITIGAQHQGVTNAPGCNTVPKSLLASQPNAAENKVLHALQGTCETVQAVLAEGAYLPWVRNNIVQAQYWKDTAQMSEYLEYNPFLPDINNEKPKKNELYADNLKALDKLVLFKFSKDVTVVPAESSHFGVLDTDKKVVDLRDQDLYKEDWLGLRQLDEEGKLHLLEIDGGHMQFSLEWFEEEVMKPFLV